MLRNREWKVLILILAIISIVAIIYALTVFSFAVAAYLLSVISIIFISFFLFTRFRYKEIENLSSYLQRISNGDESLDIRDNVEGELSILKK